MFLQIYNLLGTSGLGPQSGQECWKVLKDRLAHYWVFSFHTIRKIWIKKQGQSRPLWNIQTEQHEKMFSLWVWCDDGTVFPFCLLMPLFSLCCAAQLRLIIHGYRYSWEQWRVAIFKSAGMHLSVCEHWLRGERWAAPWARLVDYFGIAVAAWSKAADKQFVRSTKSYC